jgi:hypothetical protein
LGLPWDINTVLAVLPINIQWRGFIGITDSNLVFPSGSRMASIGNHSALSHTAGETGNLPGISQGILTQYAKRERRRAPRVLVRQEGPFSSPFFAGGGAHYSHGARFRVVGQFETIYFFVGWSKLAQLDFIKENSEAIRS